MSLTKFNIKPPCFFQLWQNNIFPSENRTSAQTPVFINTDYELYLGSAQNSSFFPTMFLLRLAKIG